MAFGLLLAFLSGGVTATSSLLVKLSAGGATVLQAAFYRNIMMVVILGTLLSVSGNDMRTLVYIPFRTLVLMGLRSVASFIGLATIYAVYQLMPLGDAAAIAGSAPIFAGIFGALILGETWASGQIVLSLIGWVGVALVVRTGDSESVSQTSTEPSLNLKIILAIAAPMSIGLSLVLSRKVSKTVKTTHAMMATFVGISCCSLISMALTEGVHLPNKSTWKYLIGDALAGLISQWLMTKALALENAAPVVLMRNSRVVVGFIFQAVIYHQPPSLQSLTGTAVIISSAIMTTLLN